MTPKATSVSVLISFSVLPDEWKQITASCFELSRIKMVTVTVGLENRMCVTPPLGCPC